MRATRYNGTRAAKVERPDWVALEAEDGTIRASCARCGARERLDQLAKPDAERALGRFCLWHRRCFDRALLPKPRAPYDPNVGRIVFRKR